MCTMSFIPLRQKLFMDHPVVHQVDTRQRSAQLLQEVLAKAARLAELCVAHDAAHVPGLRGVEGGVDRP